MNITIWYGYSNVLFHKVKGAISLKRSGENLRFLKSLSQLTKEETALLL